MNHKLIAEMHAAFVITRRENGFFISAVIDHLICFPVGLIPSGSLVRTWNCQIQADIGAVMLCFDYFQCAKGIKPKSSAADKPSVSQRVIFPDNPVQPFSCQACFRG